MNFSLSEIIVVLVVALLVVKPEQLPDVAFSLGRFAKSMQRMMAKIKNEMTSLMDEAEKSSEEKK